MTLIEAREALEPHILSSKRPPSSPSTPPFDGESGSDDEFLIANENYPEDGDEHHHYRDFFSLPTLGLNYFNNLNLSLNLNLNLRNSPLWRIYENTSFTKPGGFLAHYLGKHADEDGLDTINEHDITPDSRGYFTLTNFLRRHGFPSYDEDCYSEEAILERVRFKKLQQQAHKLGGDEDPHFEEEYPEVTQQKTYNIYTCDRFREEEERAPCTPELISEVEVPSEVYRHHGEVLEEPKTAVPSVPEMKAPLQKKVSLPASAGTLNPFYNRVELTFWTKLKIGLVTLTILLFRIFFMASVLILALLLVLLGMCGVTFEESQNHPLVKWRRGIRWILANVVMRAFVFVSGFVWTIKETGRRARPEEAPIFVVGPHSSYFDAFAVILLGAPSVVAKLSTKDIPVFGRLVTLTQAVYVSRESKGSRRQTMEVLKTRAQGVYRGSGMPQIFIFPEGTCSNRSSLIKFKPGAFAPGVPVQPVLIRYPNQFDACTWTFDGPPAAKNIWYALSQLYNKIEIEYLPVYQPSEEEIGDSALFAENVRRVMAKALGVPCSDYQFEDGTLLCAMREKKVVGKMRSIQRAKRALGVQGAAKEGGVMTEGVGNANGNGREWEMGFQDFQREFYHVSSEDTTVPEVQAVFNSFKKGGEEEETEVDVRPYLALTWILYEEKSGGMEELPRKLCQMYGLEESPQEIKAALEALFEISETPDKSQSNSSGSVAQTANDIEQRISRLLEFAKLFADEVTERLPKTYPSRQERDHRAPSVPAKSKSD